MNVLFKDVTREFLDYQAIYSDDRRTTPSNIKILTRHLGDLPVPDIGPIQIEAMIAARLKEGVGRSTLNRQRATLSRFFTWAMSRGYHPGPNPVKKVRKFRESAGRTRYLMPAEADRLTLAAAPHLKDIIVMALDTGGRLGELLALRRRDGELERRLVVFRRETTKSRRERIVPMSERVASIFRRLAAGQPDEAVFRFRGESLKSIKTAFRHARLKAGLQDLHFHDLRHTFASWFVQNGGDLYRLQKYLGHTDIKLTQRYSHLSAEFLEQGVSFIGPPGSRSAKRQDGDPS